MKGGGFNPEKCRMRFDVSFMAPKPAAEEPADIGQAEEEKTPIRVAHRYGHRHLTRKAASEAALAAQIDWHFREGDCYH